MLLMKEPVKLASILDPAPTAAFSTLTKIIGTLGPTFLGQLLYQRTSCKGGMSVARFRLLLGRRSISPRDFGQSQAGSEEHWRLCGVMLDTVGPELQIVNGADAPIELVEGNGLTLHLKTQILHHRQRFRSITRKLRTLSSQVTRYSLASTSIQAVKLLPYGLRLSTRMALNVECVIKNSATLTGNLFTALASKVRIGLPTLN